MTRPYELVVLSASSSDELAAAARGLARFLAGRPSLPLAAVAGSLVHDRPRLPHRLALVARDCADAARRLQAPAARETHIGHATTAERPLAFLFPGVGDHYAGMAAGLYRSEPLFRSALDHCAEVLINQLGRDLREILYPENGEAAPPADGPHGRLDLARLLGRDERSGELDRTATAQPLVFAVEYALARFLMGAGIRPTALAGYSLGEYVAACAAEVLAPEDALELVARRAKLIETAPEGAMVAVMLGADHLADHLDGELSLSAADGPRLSVVGGRITAVERLERRLAAEGVASLRLPTRHAFHTAMLEPFEEGMRELAAGFPLRPPTIPLLSNVTGTWLTEVQATSPEYWAQHMSRTVRFEDELAELWRLPAPILVEVGAGRTLGTLVQQHPGRRPDGTILSTLPTTAARDSDVAGVLTALGRLWVEGVDVNWPALFPDGPRERLPHFVFEGDQTETKR
ncbi:acyltransferase domain-containing protein [Actinomadura citrea]|uniref:Acyl transferase domain-containing protein n=1 Tax=Actinomadura citrea TaxID=46158 RepID=A0A7Y9GAG4_9ACTN|nr:acyltransferase domain-containing protein [Actinomadura citrea]NYE11480.1 acyl transferase domain-containing protein [Actinomadura citrea]GGT88023.1 acyltransferase [Actinomadura citrea]